MAMADIAFLFPGQGSQRAGMGVELYRAYKCARETFDEADAVLRFGLAKLCFEGPEEELRLTANTQPAILAHSVAVYRALSERGLRPNFAAGHSLGEYSALVASGSLSFGDALRLVRERGKFMQEAVPDGDGAMAAIIGLEGFKVEDICRSASEHGIVQVANFNSPEQVVLAGEKKGVEAATEIAMGSGAKRVIFLQVSAPFHCSLMKPAQEKLSELLDRVELKDPSFPVYSNVSAAPSTSAEEVREALKKQVSAPVRWEESMRRMIGAGARKFVEVGPGKVLQGLLKRIEKGAVVFGADLPPDIERIACALAA